MTGKIALAWAALLTGTTGSRGRGTVGDDIRDATGRVPILWFVHGAATGAVTVTSSRVVAGSATR
jgi:hypothetical protein